MSITLSPWPKRSQLAELHALPPPSRAMRISIRWCSSAEMPSRRACVSIGVQSISRIEAIFLIIPHSEHLHTGRANDTRAQPGGHPLRRLW